MFNHLYLEPSCIPLLLQQQIYSLEVRPFISFLRYPTCDPQGALALFTHNFTTFYEIQSFREIGLQGRQAAGLKNTDPMSYLVKNFESR